MSLDSLRKDNHLRSKKLDGEEEPRGRIEIYGLSETLASDLEVKKLISFGNLWIPAHKA